MCRPTLVCRSHRGVPVTVRGRAADLSITLLITTNEIVQLATPAAAETSPLVDRDAFLDAVDLVIDAYDAEGRSLGILKFAEGTDDATVMVDVVRLSHRDPLNPGKEFLVQIDEGQLADAYAALRAGGTSFEIHTLLFSIPKAAMEQADIAHVTAIRNDAHVAHTNARAAVYRVDLVDDDEGTIWLRTTPVSLTHWLLRVSQVSLRFKPFAIGLVS